MKLGKSLFLVLVLFCAFSVCANAQLAVVDGAVQSLLTAMGIDQVIYYAQSLAELSQNVQNSYQQIQHMIRAEQRALENLRSIVDVRNFDDFMKWQNRQLYLEREVEDRFDNIGVKIGKNTYTLTELDKIPSAMRDNYGDPYWDDFTEEQREEMYFKLGLAPANYNYVKTWSAREDMIAKRLLTRGEILDEENAQAAEGYQNLIQKYRQSREDLDTNELLKNSHMTMMQIEMVLRDLSRAIAAKDEYDMAKDKKSQAPANPPRLSDQWNKEIFGNISKEPGSFDD